MRGGFIVINAKRAISKTNRAPAVVLRFKTAEKEMSIPENKNVKVQTISPKIAKNTQLTTEEELKLFQAYKLGCHQSWEKLLLNLVEFSVKKFANRFNQLSRDLSYQDLVQEGCIGAIKAIENFDPSFGYPLYNYAYDWIRLYIRQAIDAKSGDIHQSRGYWSDKRRINKLSDAMFTETGSVDWNEISRLTGMGERRIKNLREGHMSYMSLQKPATTGEGSDGASLENFIEDKKASDDNPHMTLEQNELKEKLKMVIQSLKPQEAKVLCLRFGITFL